MCPIPACAIRGEPQHQLVESKEAFWTYFIGFKIDKEGVNDPAVRRAMVMAVDQAAIAKNLYFGEVEPAYSYISQNALDWNKKLDPALIKTNVAEANKHPRRGRLGARPRRLPHARTARSSRRSPTASPARPGRS